MEKRYVSSDIQDICTVCLSKDDNLTLLDDNFEKHLDVYERLTSIQLSEMDIPIQMCHLCLEQLNMMVLFRKTCMKSHKILRTMLGHPDKPPFETDSDDSIYSEEESEEEEEEASTGNSDVISSTTQAPNSPPVSIDKDSTPSSSKETNPSMNLNEIGLIAEDCDVRAGEKNEEKLDEIFAENDELESDSEMEEDNSELVNNTGNGDSQYKLDLNLYSGETLECSICVETFTDHKSLEEHITSLHTSKDYKCAICDEAFNIPFLLSTHMKIHKRHVVSSVFQCSRCGKSYKSIVNLTFHMHSHLGIKPFVCEVCKRRFVSEYILRTHSRLHTEDKTHSCEKCGKFFTTAVALFRHGFVHEGLRPHKCEHCPRRFVTTGSLKVHLRTHTGEKPYLCSECGRGFQRSTHLKMHKVTHTGEKPYKCSQCDKVFSQKGNMKYHERTHTGEKPYCCTICHEQFAERGHLTYHMNKHIIKIYTCDSCGERFKKPKDLETHKIFIHDDLSKNENRKHNPCLSFECQKCGENFPDMTKIAQHFVIHEI